MCYGTGQTSWCDENADFEKTSENFSDSLRDVHVAVDGFRSHSSVDTEMWLLIPSNAKEFNFTMRSCAGILCYYNCPSCGVRALTRRLPSQCQSPCARPRTSTWRSKVWWVASDRGRYRRSIHTEWPIGYCRCTSLGLLGYAQLWSPGLWPNFVVVGLELLVGSSSEVFGWRSYWVLGSVGWECAGVGGVLPGCNAW